MNRSDEAVFRRGPKGWRAAAQSARTRGWAAGTGAALAVGLASMPSAWAQTVTTSGNVYDHGTPVAPGSQASPWSVGALTVGFGVGGAGSLAVQNGGVVVSSFVVTVGDLGGSGLVTIDGAGSTVTTQGFQIGTFASGPGTLTVSNGALANAGYVSLTNSGGAGTLNLLGTAAARGVLETGYMVAGTGPAPVINIDGGILRALGDQPNFMRSFPAGAATIGAGGAYIDTQSYNVGVTTAGIFTGAGSLSKLGTGTLTLAGGNTWSGDTTVADGTLTLGSYTQGAGQTLTVGASSASSYGKLHVAGTAAFAAGSRLAVDVASANTLANGQVLAGVISAGTLNATTFNTTDNSALFDFTAVKNGNSVDLGVRASGSDSGSGSGGTGSGSGSGGSGSGAGAGSGSGGSGSAGSGSAGSPPSSGSGSTDTGSTGTTVYSAVRAYHLRPAYGAARVLDTQVQGTPAGDMANVVTALGRLPDARSVARAADQTLPLNSGGDAIMGMLSTVNRLFDGRYAPGAAGAFDGDAAHGKHVWIKPFGSLASQDDRDGASGFSAATGGLAAGVEGEWGATRLGLAYAYANTRVDGNTALSGADSSIGINSNVLAVYGSRPIHGLDLGFQLDTGWSDSSGSRNLSFGGLKRVAHGDYGTWSAHAGASLSKAIALGANDALVPALRIDYTQLRSQAYTETGAGALDLNVDSQTSRALVVGVDGRYIHAWGEHSQIEAGIGVGYDTINDAGDLVAAYAGVPGQAFTVAGIGHSPWVLRGGVGYTYKTGQGMDVSLRYDAQGRSGYLNQLASIKATWSF